MWESQSREREDRYGLGAGRRKADLGVRCRNVEWAEKNVQKTSCELRDCRWI